ncbi:unknown similar to AMEV126 [Adoxophyes honmai entomopoxvirus 'L']|uniref:Uncharacterized protein n=1 Tax=Adoxophyes honmai entomopoxvirus 'L' TaxID=1293540 RepID=A0A916KP50_9POXV|nr:unknown similar to AMEV126 [Adoxophyes honmai entomopoxvirus 'L']CCU55517.1 unknown similar to AMEV126 [Adoxophyes honmai entomopoxvirus 'L']
MEKLLYVRNLFYNFITMENKKYVNKNNIEKKIIDRLQFLWTQINYNNIMTYNIEYFYYILEEQDILNWRLDETGFEEYNDYYHEFLMTLLDINCDNYV